MGQSPFALQRGQRFEARLFKDDAAVLLGELERARVLSEGSKGFLDVRTRRHGGPSKDLDDARSRTLELFRALAAHGITAATPRLVAGATLCVPGRAMLPEAILVLDALVVRPSDAGPELVVGEVKTYPDRGGHTDRSELAGARAQAGVYVHGVGAVLREEGLAPRIRVSTSGFLVLTKPGSNRPSVRPNEDLQYQALRAERGLEKLRALADEVAPDGAPPSDPIASVLGAATHYEESCLRFCDRASGCFARARAADSPAILGDDVARLLGSMSLRRARDLLRGAKPKSPAEVQLVQLVREGGGM